MSGVFAVMTYENKILEERMNIHTPSDKIDNTPSISSEFSQKIKATKSIKSPKKTLVFILSTVVVLLLLGSLFIPFASTNALSKIFSTFGNERYAIGADLLANKSVGSALSVLSFDPTQPDSCKGGWAAVKDMKVADVIANNQAINSSFAEIRVHPANKELVSGTIGTTMSIDGDTTQLGIQGSFDAGLQQILDWGKQVIAVVTKNEAGQEAILSSEKQVQDIINQTGWNNLHLEAKGSLWNGANSM